MAVRAARLRARGCFFANISLCALVIGVLLSSREISTSTANAADDGIIDSLAERQIKQDHEEARLTSALEKFKGAKTDSPNVEGGIWNVVERELRDIAQSSGHKAGVESDSSSGRVQARLPILESFKPCTAASAGNDAYKRTY